MNKNNSAVLFSGSDYLPFRNTLTGFSVTSTNEVLTNKEHPAIIFDGIWNQPADNQLCPCCGGHCHVNNAHQTIIKHIPIASYSSSAIFDVVQYICPTCGKTFTPQPEFKHPHHRISNELFHYIEQLLAFSALPIKAIANYTQVCSNIVKDIDKERLKRKYTIDGTKLKPPDKQARLIGIDEFKLHNHHKYATHIINLETGDILFIAHGKKKQVVYDFIELVGDEYMRKIEAMACDMNSDFYEAFKEKYPHIKVVFDHFHIVKNFNDKVVSEVRKDEIKRLVSEGKYDEARSLRSTKYILTASKATLEKRDREREEGKVINKGSKIFNTEDVTRKREYQREYNLLLQRNELFLKIDLIKEWLTLAYQAKTLEEMKKNIIQIIVLCKETENRHFKWFARLLDNHIVGILNHSQYCISNGKIEGINNKIKTIRRIGYGYPDDEYFFLKLIDMSRVKNSKTGKSH